MLERVRSVWSTQKGKSKGRRDTRRVGDRGRAKSRTGGGWWPEEGAGRTFLASLSRALAGNQAGRRQVVRADNGAEECGTWD